MRTPGGKDGIALVMTLWVIVLLTVVAMSFSFSTRRSSASTRNMKQDTQAYFLALSAHEEALAYLITDPDPMVDYIDEDGTLRTDTDRPAIAGIRVLDNATVEVRLSDEESRLNINRLNAAALKRLFSYAEVPEDEIQGLVDSIADWKDADDLHHLSGAEDEYYESLGYKPKNRFFDTPEELLLIKGFRPEYLSGVIPEEEMPQAALSLKKPLGPLLTVYGYRLNVYTATPDVMRIYGLSEADITAIQRRRQIAAQQRTGLLAGTSTPGRGRTFSSHFRIQTLARVSNNPMAVRITAVVQRVFRAGKTELKTLYWREDFERVPTEKAAGKTTDGEREI